MEAVVVACAVLHNIAIGIKEKIEFVHDEKVEAQIQLALVINPDYFSENRNINQSS